MRINTTAEVCEAQLEENIVSTTVQELLEEFRKLFDKGVGSPTLRLDLGAVRIIDSQGLNLLIGLYRECERKEVALQVTNASEETRRLFRMFKLNQIFGTT